MAAEAAKIQPEPAQQETPTEPVQEAPQAETAEHWTKKPFEGGSLAAAEKAAEMRGLGKEMEEKAEAETGKFEEETKSFWGRVKGRLFRKKEGEAEAPVKGEAEILAEIEKADAVFANFRQEMARIMASGGEAELRALEGSLSAAYDQLAPQVAAEGAGEADAMKRALKTGKMPQMTETGAKLNYVAKGLAEVRAKLNGGAAPEAPARKPEPAAAEMPAPRNETPAPQEAPQEAPAEASQPTVETVEAPAPVETSPDRELLLKQSAGKPGEKLVDEYLKLKDVGSDAFGVIVGKSFDPIKGEIRLKYEDGGQLRTYASGMKLRIHPGGRVEELKDAPAAAATPEAPPEEGTEESPILLTPEMKTASVEGVVSGETESRPEPAPVAEEPSVIVEAPKPSVMKTSEQSPVASGEIEAPKPPKPKTPQEDYPNLPKPLPGSRPPGVPQPMPEPVPESVETPSAPEAPAPPAETPKPASEKKEFPMDKLEAAASEIAEKLLPAAKASDAPKTYGSKVVGKMPAAEFLKLFTDAGKITAEEAGALAEEFKTDPESLNAARKKTVAALNKLAR